ncbi:MAG TPA: type III secretion system stator protein SctL, partial [Trinickia sp.]|nr:type III secretion system stator protein SctL [Trinickia sp.]
MVIWLRNSQAEGAEAGYGVGIEGDVLRGEDLKRLVDIDAGYDEMRKECEAALAAAHDRAQAIVDEAQAQAEALLARAQADYDRGAQLGYDDGITKALTDWHERVSRQADAGTLGRRRRDRLAELVALAAEEIIASADPAALFARAAATVERIVADGSPVEVCVHPTDVAAATEAFTEVALGWREAGRAVRLNVRADAALAPGACVCETDLGAVDASLSLQLEAMRGALARAVQSAEMDADEIDDANEDEGDFNLN